MTSKYIDIPSTMQVIGNIYQNPNLLDNSKYIFREADFVTEFHRILFGSIYNLHQLGAKEITLNTIEDYLAQRPKQLGIYKANKGDEYLIKIKEITQLSTFDYYYNRLKKMTLLRMYDKAGLDLSWIYDINNILDAKKKQQQEDWLDNTSLEDIADLINEKIESIKAQYVDNSDNSSHQAGEGIFELLERLKKEPDIGYPMFGPFINTITRGARLKKFYLRSAATNVGKSRSMIADACNFACDELYDLDKQQWIQNGSREPTLYITTEQDLEEVQTMMIAFLSGVNEKHILDNEYYEGELDRVMYAAKLLSNCPIKIKIMHDFSIVDIENTIKSHIHQYKIKYVCFDYIHTSMKILEEVTSKTGMKGLREDNVLFMISTKLKDICNEYGIFILSSTQLNSEYREAQVYDQNLLRGAKAIADKIDIGMIMLEVDNDDREKLRPILTQKGFPDPTIKISVYKNRRGEYKNILLWCKANLGICRIEPIFITDYNYRLQDIPDFKIKVDPSIMASDF